MKRLLAAAAVVFAPDMVGTGAAAQSAPREITIVRTEDRPTGAGPSTTFTGQVLVDPLFNPQSEGRTSGAHVTFLPGARTHWHTHPVGQTLIVTDGAGWVQSWGGEARVLRPGDVVWIPAGVKHWHGAGATTALRHIAIQEAVDGTPVEWLEAVPDDQYVTATQN